MRSSVYDAVVVGSGPNGPCAAITLAEVGRSVATPPGGGVHGLCWFDAARATLRAHLR